MLPLINFVVPSYLIFSTIGIICTVIYLFFRMERYQVKFLPLLFYCVIGVICLFLGSRIIFLISVLPSLMVDFSGEKLLFYLLRGGIVFYGGMLGVLLAIWICSKIRKDNFKKMCNYFAPAIPLFHMFGRLACFLGGCCYGKPVAWGIPMAADPDVSRIPIQVFESGFNLIIFIFLVVYEHKKKEQKFNLLLLYLLCYPTGRFVLEFFRGDIERGMWGFLSTSQIISLIILACCLAFILVQKFRLKSGKGSRKA